jgi:uncharacterized membrane protein
MSGTFILVIGIILIAKIGKINSDSSLRVSSRPAPAATRASKAPDSNAIAILKEKLATGEISEEEFIRKKQLLES